MKKAIICFTQVPQAGKTKTRLNNFMSGEDSAALNSAFLRDISQVLQPYDADVFIAYTPEGDHWELRRIFPYALAFFAQKGGNLGERMHNALQYVLELGYDAAVLTGADLPLLNKNNFDSAFDALENHDVTYGPSGDGGYYLVGMKKPCPELFANQPYGREDLYESSVKRVQELGLSFAPATKCSDVDTVEDLRALFDSMDSQSHTAKLMELLGFNEGCAEAEEAKPAQNFPFWDRLSKLQKKSLSSSCHKEFLKKGSSLEAGEDRGLMLLRSGAVRVYIVSKEGRQLNLYHLGPGELCVPAAKRLVPELDFDPQFEVVEDSQVLCLGTDYILSLMDVNSAVELSIYRTAMGRMSSVMHILQRVIFEKLDKRLAAFLLEEAERGRGKTVLATHDHIACEIGSAREVVSKTLKRMAKDGIIKLSYNRIEILDTEALRLVGEE